MYFKVAARPSTSTVRPASAIFANASLTNIITSPWVTAATLGILVATSFDFNRVLLTLETLSFTPRPSISTSKASSSNLSNLSILVNSARFSGFKASSSSTFFSSANLVASSVMERKISPLDQVVDFGNFSLSLATVVPFPVPESPSSVMMHPFEGASPSFSMISAVTSSGLFPRTLIATGEGSALSLGRTPLSIASLIPTASLALSSSSLFLISAVVIAESLANP
mmetsp:Transcript_36935/g.59213  ORF Transcript_36935/g.59213 Transcript_36935/m.59213 type:complete len:226 (-) Transcript_36935:892-1569(-)